MIIDRFSEGCALPQRALEQIQRGILNYTYKGVPTYKSPFDLALYQLLLWEQKPRSLIEIGAKWGGSALWFADTLRSYGVDYEIHSVDIQTCDRPDIPGVKFHKGDGRALSNTLPPSLLSALPRPIMIIEDADHRPKTTLAVLEFFDRWLSPGEYVIIEDGIVDDLFDKERMAELEGGPRPAIEEFLRAHGANYEIDARFCDYFGPNMTWNVNGYLRRVR
jgi:cephalosporin hydroxylase